MKLTLGISGHRKGLLFALAGVLAALLITVVSFAATSDTVTVSITPVDSVAGSFGSTTAQAIPGSAVWQSDTSTTVTVDSAANFAEGDYVLIDQDGDGDPAGDAPSAFSYHTVNAISGNQLSVSPDIVNAYSSGASVTEPARFTAGATWSPRLQSTSGVTAGNHFMVNLHGLSTSDSAFVELLTTNPHELTKNYTFLNRSIGVYVLCESSSACSGAPYASSTPAGAFGNALNVSGEEINAVPDFLTLTTARLSWVLAGGHVYAISIDGGSLFTIGTATTGGAALSPDDQVSITAR